MITESSLYWITRLNPINDFATTFLVIGAGTLIISLITWGIRSDSNLSTRGAKLTTVWSFICTVFFSLVLVFTPTMKEMCAIKVVPAIVNNEKIQTVGNEFYSLAVDWMRELHPTNLTESVKGELRSGLKGAVK